MLDMLKSPPQGYDLPLIIALGKIHASDAVPVLSEIVRGTGRSGGDFVAEMRRHRAVEALGRIGPNATQSVPLLVHLLEQQGFGNLGQLYLADRICRALGEMGPSAHEAIPVLTRLVSNPSQLKSHATVSRSAAAALARIQPKQQK